MTTRNENSYREKGRALFLAVMMVVSVVAMSAAFAGAAAAQNNYYETVEDDYEDGPTINLDDDDLDDFDYWVGQEITVTDDDGNYLDDNSGGDDALSAASGVEIHEGLAPSDEADSDNRVGTELVDDDEIEIDTSELDAGEPYHLVWSGLDSDDFDQGNVPEFWVEDEDLDVSFDDDYILEDETATLEYESDRDVQTVNVTETGEGLEAEDIEDIFDHDLGANDDYLENVKNGDYHGVDEYHDVDDVATFEIVMDDDGERDLTANMDDFDAGDYEFEFDHTDSLASENASLEVRDDDADRTIDAPMTQEGDSENISITLEDTDTAAVQVGDYDDNNYEVGFLIEDDNGYDEINLTMNTYKAGGGHTDGEAFEEFEDAWDAEQDDVEVTPGYINMTDGEELYITDDFAETLGDYDDAGELINDEVLKYHSEAIEYDDSGEIESGDTFDDPLATGDYELTVGDTWEVDDGGLLEIADDDDSSFLTITERSAPGDVATHTAPEDDSMGDLEDFEDATVTETGDIADEDHMLITVEDFGSTGVLDDAEDGDQIGQQLAEQGVFLELEQQDTTNQPDRVWNNSALSAGDNFDDDYALDFEFVNGDDYEGDELIIKVPFDDFDIDDYDNDVDDAVEDGSTQVHQDYVDELDDDEDYDWQFSITEDNPYVDDEDEEVEVDDELSIDERSVSLDGENDELETVSESNVTGTTTVAPGTEVDVRVAASGEFVEDGEAYVDSDRVFDGAVDLSDEEEGLEVEVEATEDSGEDDDMDAVLVEGEEEEPETGIDLDVDYDDIDEGETAEFDATVDNNGDEDVSVDVTLEIDGETHNETLDIDGDDSATESFAVEDLGVGDHDFTVDADSDDDSDSYDGTLTVEEEGVDDDDDAPADDEDDADDDDAPEDDDDDDDDDGTPGFGVAVALVALLSAAMLALRRQD